MPGGPPYVAVVGSGDGGALDDVAYAVGRRLAEAGAVLVTGGLGGVMAAASRGAVEAGGTTVGVLPGLERAAANPYLTVALPTGLGEARNALVVRAADVVIAVGGEWGTLSEIALTMKTGTPVVGIATWELRRPGQDGRPGDVVEGVRLVADAESAVQLALSLATKR